MVRICFVCMGNICRSPTAEGIMLQLVEQAGLSSRVSIDSAGTGAWHVGELADGRSRAVAKKRGVELVSRARQFHRDDFHTFDYVIAMDARNFADLEAQAPDDTVMAKLHMLRTFDDASPKGASVPDPYYGGAHGFDDVFDICEAACRGLLEHIIATHQLR